MPIDCCSFSPGGGLGTTLKSCHYTILFSSLPLPSSSAPWEVDS